MRRAVGSIAWCVLEHLAETAEDRAGNTVSYESVRSTAGALGFANDTVVPNGYALGVVSDDVQGQPAGFCVAPRFVEVLVKARTFLAPARCAVSPIQ